MATKPTEQYYWATNGQRKEYDAGKKESGFVQGPLNKGEAPFYQEENHARWLKGQWLAYLEAKTDELTIQSGTIGIIKMFDGAGWVDNQTMPGWFACIPGNDNQTFADAHNGVKCPDLVNKFVMGAGITAWVETTNENGFGQVGGANSYSLSAGQLPVHAHSIEHDHGQTTASVGNQNTTHYHPQGGNSSPYGIYNTSATVGGFAGTSTQVQYKTGSNVGNHVHIVTVNLANYTGSSGNAGSGNAIENRPVFYSLIFIKRVE